MGADFKKGQNDPRDPQVREGIRRRQEAAARELSSRGRSTDSEVAKRTEALIQQQLDADRAQEMRRRGRGEGRQDPRLQRFLEQQREYDRDQAMRRAAQSRAPQQSPPPGFEEATFRRAEVEKARGGLGRRASALDQLRARELSYERERELRNKFEGQSNEMRRRSQAQPTGERRSGMVFGPGRSMRMPEGRSPEYQQILDRLRSMRGGN
mgnify:CR=1 FL=1